MPPDLKILTVAEHKFYYQMRARKVVKKGIYPLSVTNVL